MDPETTEGAKTTIGYKRLDAKRRAHLLEGEVVFFIGTATNYWEGLEVFYLTTHRLIAYASKRVTFAANYQEITGFETKESKSGFTVKTGPKSFAFLRLPNADRSALQAALETFGVDGPGPESWRRWTQRRAQLQADYDAVMTGKEAARQEVIDREHLAREQEEALREHSRTTTWPNTRLPHRRPNSATALSILRNCREGEEPWLILSTATAGALVAFDDRLMIIKAGAFQGFMAGSLGGERSTTFYYRDITGIEYNSGFMSGVLEVLTASYQGTANKDFWQGTTKSRNADSNDPWTLSNTLPLEKFIYVQCTTELNELRERISRAKGAPAPQAQASAPVPVDLVAQLAQLGQLRDSGVLSDDEFASAKARILGDMP